MSIRSQRKVLILVLLAILFAVLTVRAVRLARERDARYAEHIRRGIEEWRASQERDSMDGGHPDTESGKP